MLASCLYCLSCGLIKPGGTDDSGSVRIGAFNVQTFGQSKIKNEEVVAVLSKIIQRYDVILIQEIRDSSGGAINTLLERVNEDGDHQYEKVISARLGRTHYKEQYCFFYRTDREFQVMDSYQDQDEEDHFEREPFSVLLSFPNSAVGQVALVGIHTKPEDAVDELNQLDDVADRIQAHWSTSKVMILGDFNADCSYVSKAKMGELDLNHERFHWLIDDNVDTTVGKSDCAYDRIIATQDLLQHIVPDSAKSFKFEEEYDLTDDLARSVSDHYPVEVCLELGYST